MSWPFKSILQCFEANLHASFFIHFAIILTHTLQELPMC